MSASVESVRAGGLSRPGLIGWAHRIASCCILAMGLGHVAATPAMMQSQTWLKALDGVYFGGAGLAVVFVAQLNLSLSFHAFGGKRARWSLYAANFAYLCFVLALAATELSPPVLVATLLALAIAVTAPFSAKE